MIYKRRNAAGDLRYGVRVHIEGKRVWLGTFDRLKDARQAEKDYDPKPKGMTCGVFARTWLAQDCPRTSGRRLKSETIQEYNYRLRAFIKEFEKETLDVPRNDAFHWALAHPHDTPFVAALFSHAHDLGLIASNPFAALGLSKGKGRKHNVPLTETQLHELADASYKVEYGSEDPEAGLPQFRDHYEMARQEWMVYASQFRAFILFQGYTGLRPGETFELRWGDIDEDRICVRRRLGKFGTVDTPKSGVERTVLLPPPARAALSSFPRSLDLVFRGVRGQRLSRSSCFRYFDKVRTAAGMPQLDLYDLRHAAAFHLYVTLGLPARVVAVQLGHNDGGRLVTELYGHGNVGALEELEAAWAVTG